jgi:hypothetical protein
LPLCSLYLPLGVPNRAASTAIRRAPPAVVQGTPVVASPGEAPPPYPPSYLSLLGTVEEPFSLDMTAHGKENSQLWVVPLVNRIFCQYIVLEASSGSLDLIPWNQGLLDTSRIFMVTPTESHKSLESWLGRIDLI